MTHYNYLADVTTEHTDAVTQDAEYEFIRDERPQRPKEEYSTLVQVGGRPSFSNVTATVEETYAQLRDV